MSSEANPDFQIVPNEAAHRIARFSREEVIAMYEELVEVPEDIKKEFYGFDLWECVTSKLVYAEPAKPGSARFYEWITKEENYYPTARPEWEIIGDAVAGLKPEDHLIDIGSGAGNLLDYLKTRTKASLHGLDATPSSVEICRRKGHHAHLGYLSDLIADKENHGKFSAIIMTHVIEHVPQPVQLMAEALTLLKRDGGRLFISTPHSPTLYEASGYHGKNLAPHHLTRWRVATYQHLAHRFGLKIEFDALAPAGGFLGILAQHFPSALRLANRSKPRLVLEALVHPVQLMQSLYWVSKRERANGKIVGSNVLAIFQY